MNPGPIDPLEPGDSADRVGSSGGGDAAEGDAPRSDPNNPLDVDAVFAQLVADWTVDTTHAVMEAERELSRENPQWRAEVPEPTYWPEDHYEPPPPPPLPRLQPRTVLTICMLAVSIALIVVGLALDIATSFFLALGVVGVIGATALFISMLRDSNDEDDDGAHV